VNDVIKCPNCSSTEVVEIGRPKKMGREAEGVPNVELSFNAYCRKCLRGFEIHYRVYRVVPCGGESFDPEAPTRKIQIQEEKSPCQGTSL